MLMSAKLLQRVTSMTGCSRATVYRALQGSPLVSAATQEKVRKAAKSIGLQVNPMVGEWMAGVRNPGVRVSRQPLLYLDGHTREEHAKSVFLWAAWQAARKRAGELGFSIEIWYVDRCANELERIATWIQQKGVRGVIIGRFPPHSPPLKLPWSEISVVAIGFTASHPPVHTVASHGFETMRYCLEELRSRGYRRPGYVGNLVTEGIGGSRHTADFLACRESFPDAWDVPLLRQLIEGDLTARRAEFLRWFHRYRPDVIVSGGILEYLAWLKEDGLRVPADVGYFHLGLRKDYPVNRVSGIPQPSSELGHAAVDALAVMLYHGERGLPLRADILQAFRRSFIEGRTLRKPALKRKRAQP